MKLFIIAEKSSLAFAKKSLLTSHSGHSPSSSSFHATSKKNLGFTVIDEFAWHRSVDCDMEGRLIKGWSKFLLHGNLCFTTLVFSADSKSHLACLVWVSPFSIFTCLCFQNLIWFWSKDELYLKLCFATLSFSVDYKVHLTVRYEYHHFQFSPVYVFKICDGFDQTLSFTPNICFIEFIVNCLPFTAPILSTTICVPSVQ